MDSLIDSITELVLRELAAGSAPKASQPGAPGPPGRQVLLCPASGTEASEPVWRALRQVEGVSWQVLVDPAASPSNLEARLAGRPWRPATGPLDDVVQRVEAVVLPSLTLDLLPRLAILLGDRPPVQAAVAALVQGTPVLAAPEEVDRFRRHAARMPAGLVAVVSQHLRTVEGLGVRLLEAGALARELAQPGALPAATASRGRDVVTREDVLSAARAGVKVFEVASGAIVTPLARETARENGIEVRQR
ncbi:MAG: hypothetical protein AB1758_03875 [Candidatus Eremiobacterota bacterium]